MEPNTGTQNNQPAAPSVPPASATNGAVNLVDTGAEFRAAERKRISDITLAARRFQIPDSDTQRFIDGGISLADFNGFILDRQAARGQQTIISSEPPMFSRRDLRGYSLCKALLQGHRELDGFEREISQEITTRIGRPPQGFYLPEEVLARPTRREMIYRAVPPDLAVTVPPLTPVPESGAVTVQLTVEPSLIEALRNRVVIGRAGATMMGGLVGNISLPRQTGVASATWNPENAVIAPTGQLFDQVGLSPKRLGAVTQYSKMLLAQSSLDIEEIVREDLLLQIGLAHDLAAIYGSGPVGANPQPTGIMSVGVNAPGGTNAGLRSPSITFGGAPTWGSVVAFEGAIESSNVPLDRAVAYITTPSTKQVWKTTPKAVNYPVYLWEGGGAMDAAGTVNGYPAYATNQINALGVAPPPAALIPNMVIFGKWSECILATWSGLDIVTDPYTLAQAFQIKIVMNLMTDVAFRNAIAFSASTDAGNV
jgi:HK97 family phage major capsid protein